MLALFIACSVFVSLLLKKYMVLHYEINKVWKHDPSVDQQAEVKDCMADGNSKVYPKV